MQRCLDRGPLQGVEGLADLLLIEVEDGVAAGALVARVDQGVEGERVVLWRGDLFFDEGAEDSELDGVERHRYKGAISRWRFVLKGLWEAVEGEAYDTKVICR